MPETGTSTPPTPAVEAAPVTEVKEKERNSSDTNTPKVGMNPKQKKIIIILVVASIGILALAVGTIGIILAVSNNKGDGSSSDSSTNSFTLTTVSGDPASSSSSTTSLNPDGTMNLSIDFTEPELITANMSIFAPTEGNEYAYDPDSDSPYDLYKLGTVLSGILSVPTDEGLLDVTNYAYYVAFRPGYISMEGGNAPDMIHFVKETEGNSTWIILDWDIYGFSDSTLFSAEVPFLIPNEVSRGVTKFLFDLELTDLAGNYLTSTEQVNYLSYGSIYPEFADEVVKEEIDRIDSTPIYKSSDDSAKMFIETLDGFVSPITLIPTLITINGQANNDIYVASIPRVSWNNGTSNTSPYDYIAIGGCGVMFGLEIVNDEIGLGDLTEVGSDTQGNPVYVQTQANNAYEEKIYNEDYIAFEFYNYNDISADDATPFTYSQFRDQHPVIYWEDEYGDIIRFANRSFVMTGGCAKPVAYLYPAETIAFSMRVIPEGQVTFTYPKVSSIDTIWSGTAEPDGSLRIDGNSYPHLWWESRKDNVLSTPKAQMVVSRDELKVFLTESLTRLGLNNAEQKDFTNFWIPKMMNSESKYFKVGFLVDSEVDQIAKLEITPKPETIRRVFMVYTPIDSIDQVKEPSHIASMSKYLATLPKLVRKGFTVIEWGGALK